MNRREALGVIGTAAVCPTAAMAIPEKDENENPDNLPVLEFDEKGQIIANDDLLSAFEKANKKTDERLGRIYKEIYVWVEQGNCFVDDFGNSMCWGESMLEYSINSGCYVLCSVAGRSKKSKRVSWVGILTSPNNPQ